MIVERAFDGRSVSHYDFSGKQFVVSIKRAAGIALRIMDQCAVVKRIAIVENHTVLRHELMENRFLPEGICSRTPSRLRIVAKASD